MFFCDFYFYNWLLLCFVMFIILDDLYVLYEKVNQGFSVVINVVENFVFFILQEFEVIKVIVEDEVDCNVC